jgi:hypothetical protein
MIVNALLMIVNALLMIVNALLNVSESARLPQVISFNQQVEMRALLPNLGTAEKLANHYLTISILVSHFSQFRASGLNFRLTYQGLRGGGIFNGSGNVDTLAASVSPSLDIPADLTLITGSATPALGTHISRPLLSLPSPQRHFLEA